MKLDLRHSLAKVRRSPLVKKRWANGWSRNRLLAIRIRYFITRHKGCRKTKSGHLCINIIKRRLRGREQV